MIRLRDRHLATFEQFENAHAIVALPNRLIHGYDAVDPAIVWDIITAKRPALEQTTRRIVAGRH